MVRLRGYLGSCVRPVTVVGVLDTLVRDTLSLRVWGDFADRAAPPAEPLAFPLAAVERYERAPGGSPRTRRWERVPLPRDVAFMPSCPPKGAPYIRDVRAP